MWLGDRRWIVPFLSSSAISVERTTHWSGDRGGWKTGTLARGMLSINSMWWLDTTCRIQGSFVIWNQLLLNRRSLPPIGYPVCDNCVNGDLVGKSLFVEWWYCWEPWFLNWEFWLPLLYDLTFLPDPLLYPLVGPPRKYFLGSPL